MPTDRRLQIAGYRWRVAGGGCGPGPALKSLCGQQGQPAAVAQVGTGQQHGAEWAWFKRHRPAVAQAQLFVALHQAAVHQPPVASMINQKLRAVTVSLPPRVMMPTGMTPWC